MFELYSYDTKYVIDEYKQYFVVTDQNPDYFTKEELKDFVEHCAKLNLEQEYENIKNGILPTYDL